MTLNDIIVAALLELNRGHDAQTIDTWRAKFLGYANDAAADIARVLRLRRSDTLTVENGSVDLNKLSRACRKVLAIYRGESRVPFITGVDSSALRVLAADGPVRVEYHYTPAPMNNPTDKPELPEYAHGLIPTYVVGRERASQDPSMQRGAQVYFELYNAGKAKLRPHRGEGNAYEITNTVERW